MFSIRKIGLCHLHKKLWKSAINNCTVVRMLGGFEEADHAALYRKYRFRPDENVIKLVMDFHNKQSGPKTSVKSTVLDVACGSGQGTVVFAPYFQHGIGVDISEAQLEEAREATTVENVEYRLGTAESLPVADNSVDLLTCIQAAHWFDFQRFCHEADRVLKPGTGCMAIFSRDVHRVLLDDQVITDRLNTLFDSLYYGTLKSYWRHGMGVDHPSYLCDFMYQLNIPNYKNLQWHTVKTKSKLSVASLVGYIESTSAYQNYHRENKNHDDILGAFQNKYLEILQVDTTPEETVLPMIAPTYVLLGNKPTIEE